MSDTRPWLTSVPREASRLADCALDVIRTSFPHRLDHTILHAGDHPLPRDIHPVFGGCYDWHSSVHMHWSLLRLCTIAPALPRRDEIVAHFHDAFTPAKVDRERSYAAEAGRASFERPYGWAWLLKLQAELDRTAGIDQAPAWRDALAPFSTEVADRLAAFLGRSHYPVRAGTHANSAFAMLLARDYALQRGDEPLLEAIGQACERWFGEDRDYPADYEPSGSDFLSGGLCEALLMQRMQPDRFADWWARFRPTSPQALQAWTTPAQVSDRRDPQGVHLDGLNLSRAWCLAGLSRHVDAQAAAPFRDAARAHWESAWPHVTTGDFVATHWLVSFALLSLDEAGA